MKFATFATALTASSVAALGVPKRDAPELRTIKLSPTEIKQVTEEEKWALKAEGKNFIDITNRKADDRSFKPAAAAAVAVEFPSAVTHQEAVTPLLAELSKDVMKSNLETFTSFQNRYYTSPTGVQSSAWLLEAAQKLIDESGAVNATARAFTHSFAQNSVIVTIPGASDKIIAMGAHQDSVNARDPNRVGNRAPGADDDGSGTVTILEAMRVLLTDEDIRTGKAPNTIEFHWYAAEEAGLLGSEDVWQAYKAEGKNAKALLQQDMTGYSKGTTDKGKPEVVGVIVDFVDTPLTNFIKLVIDEYCDIGYVETKCGYACSDHASASEAGYPSSFVFESEFADDNPYIHTANDTIAALNFDHVLQHAKLTLGFAYELAYAEGL